MHRYKTLGRPFKRPVCDYKCDQIWNHSLPPFNFLKTFFHSSALTKLLYRLIIIAILYYSYIYAFCVL